ncbi:hypothetical protein QA634_23760 [Methylobacterium sp. CB376]|nr:MULTISPECIES: hypothetical protein [Methylobacterium]WFT78272.1 hypothetical protein QA634_23760 [Methylobacterium nodulans]
MTDEELDGIAGGFFKRILGISSNSTAGQSDPVQMFGQISQQLTKGTD